MVFRCWSWLNSACCETAFLKNSFVSMFWCPNCKTQLQAEERPRCGSCGSHYRLQDGFYVFDSSPLVATLEYGHDQYILDIENAELFDKLHRYIIPNLGELRGKKILSVGCGGGADIAELNQLGAQAYGMDFSYRVSQWRNQGLSLAHLFVSSSRRIPFPLNYFDVILCMGVIEHVSEQLLATQEYEKLSRERQEFLNILIGVLKPGGVFIITSPNRNFPIDFQHDVYGWLHFFRKYSIYVHSPFTRLLESYYSLLRHLSSVGVFRAEPLPLKDFFGFNVTKLSPRLALFRKFFEWYARALDVMPKYLRYSFLNPYIVLKITKL